MQRTNTAAEYYFLNARTEIYTSTLKITLFWDFPGGPVVKNLTSNAWDAGLIPGCRTKIPHAAGN